MLDTNPRCSNKAYISTNERESEEEERKNAQRKDDETTQKAFVFIGV